MCRSTASTTTMASSTTRPIASTKPKRDKGVDGEAKHGEDHEGSDQRYGDGQERDQGRAPALEEDVDHQNHQRESLQQGIENVLHAGGDGGGGIEADGVIEIGGEALAELGNAGAEKFGGVDRVGARELIAGQNRRGLAVIATGEAIGLRAQFEAGDVFETRVRTVGVGA